MQMNEEIINIHNRTFLLTFTMHKPYFSFIQIVKIFRFSFCLFLRFVSFLCTFLYTIESYSVPLCIHIAIYSFTLYLRNFSFIFSCTDRVFFSFRSKCKAKRNRKKKKRFCFYSYFVRFGTVQFSCVTHVGLWSFFGSAPNISGIYNFLPLPIFSFLPSLYQQNEIELNPFFLQKSDLFLRIANACLLFALVDVSKNKIVYVRL